MTRPVLALVLLLAAALTGCMPTAPVRDGRNSGRVDPIDWRAAKDELSMTMRKISEQLEAVGLEPARAEVRGFLVAGSRKTHRIRVPSHRCATLVAIASRGVRDLDAALYSPEGELLASDTQPDAHPTIQLCAGERVRDLYYMLQIYEGAGSFLMVPFLGPRSALAGAGKLLGGQPAVARLDGDDPEPLDRITAFRGGLQRRGFEPQDAPLDVALSGEQSVRISLRVEPGACYTAAAFGLEGLDHIQLRVVDDEGIEVARDEAPSDEVAAQFCADRRAEYAAEVRGQKGQGSTVFQVFRADTAVLGGVSGLWLGERPLTRAALHTLDEARAAVKAEATRDGFRRVREIEEGRITAGEVRRIPVEMPRGRCSRLHVVGGQGVRMLTVSARDADGIDVGQSSGDSLTTYLHVCSSDGRGLTLTLSSEGGGGRFAVVSHEAQLASIPPNRAEGAVRASYLQAVRRARDAGYRPHGAFEKGPRKVALGKSDPHTVLFGAESARCIRAYAISAGPNVKTELRVKDEVVASGGDGKPARYCSTADASLDIVSVDFDTGAPEAWLMVLVK
ncbi:MAG: hypothetical protein OEZ06_22825 [Myxococcales bacterium]|nr:hypothetical protein [Myxococcales bacterium]